MLSDLTIEKIAKLAKSLGLNIYDIEFLKENDRAILRISITKKSPMQCSESNTISLEDCQNLSELISPLLDVEASSMSEYNLEVSSPGLERALKKLEHYEFSLGELISVKTMQKEQVSGILKSVDSEKITIEREDKKSINLEFADIKKAKVVFEL